MNQPIQTPDATAGPGYVAEPMPVTATAAALPALSRQARYARIGLLGIAAAGLVAAALLIFTFSTSPNGTLAAGTTNGNSNATTNGNGNATTNGPVDLLNGLGPDGKRGHFGLGGITITAISGNNLSLETVDGWTRKITVDSGTTYSKSGATISLGDLRVGDEIGFRQTREANGTWTIDSVVVILPRAGGEVTKIDGSTITVTQRDGTTATIKVNGQTTYAVNGSDTAALSDVKVGMQLVAEGTKNSDGSLMATRVRAGTPGAFEGRGGRFGPGFGPGWDGQKPDASSAPSATGAAS